MNLNEFRNAMSSDVTIENERLKQNLADVEKKYDDMCKAYTEKIRILRDDCRALANRCFTLTHGLSCMFCQLNEYDCPHALSTDDKIVAAEIMKIVYGGDINAEN